MFTANYFADDIQNVIVTDVDWLDRIQNSIIGIDEMYTKSEVMTLDNLAYVVYSSGTTGRPKGQCSNIYVIVIKLGYPIKRNM